MVGIPIYSAVPTVHDYVVQARGAFDETIRGILNLKRFKQRVEIRIVIHSKTVSELRAISEFIIRNLIFVDHVAFMGLELMGFAKPNVSELWIDPPLYQGELRAAVERLAAPRVPLSIYNLPLDVIPPLLFHLPRQYISD